MSDDLVSKRRAERCTTHSHACDCREYAHAQEIERLRAENDLWKSQVHDEMAANLAFRAAGGALQDEDMPTFCARIIAERDALRARIEGAAVGFWCEAMPAYICLPKNWLEVVKPWTDGKRVALVPVDE